MKPLLRKVKTKTEVHGDYSINGYFHEWGKKSIPNGEHGYFQVSAGTIEAEDGTMKQCPIDYIQFVEEF